MLDTELAVIFCAVTIVTKYSPAKSRLRSISIVLSGLTLVFFPAQLLSLVLRALLRAHYMQFRSLKAVLAEEAVRSFSLCSFWQWAY